MSTIHDISHTLNGKPLNNTIFSDMREIYVFEDGVARPKLMYMSDHDIRRHQKRILDETKRRKKEVNIITELWNIILVIVIIFCISYIYTTFGKFLFK